VPQGPQEPQEPQEELLEELLEEPLEELPVRPVEPVDLADLADLEDLEDLEARAGRNLDRMAIRLQSALRDSTTAVMTPMVETAEMNRTLQMMVGTHLRAEAKKKKKTTKARVTYDRRRRVGSWASCRPSA
jgi:hypothetical protein